MKIELVLGTTVVGSIRTGGGKSYNKVVWKKCSNQINLLPNIGYEIKMLEKANEEYGQVMSVIYDWCDENYDNCYRANFIELNDEKIKITKVKDGKWKISGTLNDGGEIKTFKSTLHKVKENKYEAKMEIEMILGTTVVGSIEGGKRIQNVRWISCSKSLDF